MDFVLGTKILLGAIAVPAAIGTAVWATRSGKEKSEFLNNTSKNNKNLATTQIDNPSVAQDESAERNDDQVQRTKETREQDNTPRGDDIKAPKAEEQLSDSDFSYKGDEKNHNDTYIFQDTDEKCEVLVLNVMRNSADPSKGSGANIDKTEIEKRLNHKDHKQNVKRACSKTENLRLYVVQGRDGFYTNSHTTYNTGSDLIPLEQFLEKLNKQ